MIDEKYNKNDHFLYSLPYFIPQEVDYYRERFSLSYHPLILICAYEITGDASYLSEAQNFVDDFDKYATNPTTGAIDLFYDPTRTVGDSPIGFVDAMIIWAKQKLNELNGKSYNIKALIDNVLSFAKANTGTDLGWSCSWAYPDLPFGGLNRFTPFASLFGYLTYKGVGNYTSEIAKIWHMNERILNMSGIYGYGFPSEEPSWSNDNPHYTSVSLLYLTLASAYDPNAINRADLQTRFNSLSAYWNSNPQDNFEKTVLSGMIFTMSPASLTPTAFYRDTMKEFYNVYDVSDLEHGDFGSMGSYPCMRGHLIQIAQVLAVLGLFRHSVLRY